MRATNHATHPQLAATNPAQRLIGTAQTVAAGARQLRDAAFNPVGAVVLTRQDAAVPQSLPIPDTGVNGAPMPDRGAFAIVPALCISDLNAVGSRNAADLFIFLGDFSTSGPSIVFDLNNDGMGQHP